MNTTNLRKTALISGSSLVIMAILAGIGFGYAFSEVYVPNNAGATITNMKEAKHLFWIFSGSIGIILLLDLLLAKTLYQFFNSTHKNLSLWLALTRLVYCVFLAIALTSLPFGNYTDDPSSVQIGFLAFLMYFQMGLIVFGIHVFLLGILILKTSGIPNWIGILSLIAGVCYFFNNAAVFLVPNYLDYKATVDAVTALPSALGELVIAFWFLFKGGKTA